MNQKQVLAVIMVVLGVVMASTTQLTELGLTPGAAKAIVGFAGMLNAILAGTLGILTTQANTVKDVQAMQGVESIVVNKQANQTLAALAVDPAQAKVEVKTSDTAAVNLTAKGD